MMRIGFIDYYLDEWHANNYPAWIRECSGGEMAVTCAYALIDSPLPNGRTSERWCGDMGIERAHSIEALIERSDALVVLSPDNCEMHEQLCQLPLRSGKPTYVDKTFAPDLETAKRIFGIAQASGTPCYSTSALRYASEYQGIGQVRAISSWGPGGFETYSIHQIEPIMMLMRAEASRVMALSGEQHTSLTIEFEDGRFASLFCFEQGSPFMMNLCTEAGSRTLSVESDFFMDFIREMIRFFRTGQPDVTPRQTLSIMAVRGAGLLALRTPGTWVSI